MFTFVKIPIPGDFYAKECLKKKVNGQKANYHLGAGPEEKCFKLKGHENLTHGLRKKGLRRC